MAELNLEKDLADWKAFAKRVTLTFPFQIDLVVKVDPRYPDRVLMGVDLHVIARDPPREWITVLTSQHVGPFESDEDGANLVFDLLRIALSHEMYESVRVDGKLVRDVHDLGNERDGLIK